jgi:diacylglycerol kinase (ATP)
MTRRRIGIVLNPAAASGKAVKSGSEIERLFASNNIEVVAITGTSAEHATELANQVAHDGLDAIVACGGDGTVHQVLPVALAHDLPLGIVPIGSGDDIARALGISRGDVAAAVATICRGETRRIDVAEVTSAGGPTVPFLGVLSAGFDSACNERANAMSWPPGRAKYLAAVIAELRAFKPVAYEMHTDAGSKSAEGMLVAIGNSSSYGGGMQVCPDAEIDDGLLDVVFVDRISTPTFLRVLPRVFNGSHVHHPAVHQEKTQSITLAGPGQSAWADGERVGPLPITVTVRPAALSVFATTGP